ncbi:Lysophospholipase L1 [Glycomyces sambucus]|uniref:Lysophospholipase L1 n=1 Tax=Glycomyces sambucus TaxID=380244 RepID=A0A1G9HXJ1_9ACTN|nr:SGNH/GDSL hydrolase family protein [Glycomyces sambucus]SDL17737.1 Lysophospholipase L1 [Glycomyces sambucus]
MSTAPLVLFTGDSITDCDRRTDPEGLGDGYVRVLAPVLAAEGFRVLNRGVSGDSANDMTRRWEADAVAEAPDVVSILVGINEVWRPHNGGAHTPTADYEADYRHLLERLPNARFVFIEPFLLPADEDQRTWRGDLEDKIAVVRRLAAEHGAPLLPADAALNALGDAAALAPDGVHPNANGHTALANLWLAETAALREELAP